MKRALLVIGLLACAALGVAAVWAWDQTRPKEVRGSSTEEFVPTQTPEEERKGGERDSREPWPVYGVDAARSHLAPDWGLRPPYRVSWTVRTGNQLEFPPVAAYGRLFVAQMRGRLFAIDAKSGEVVWRKRFRHCSAASPAVRKGVVFFALMQPYPCSKGDRGQRGFVVALKVQGGRELWRFHAGAVESSPLVVRKLVYFGSWDRHLYAVDRETGELAWKFEADDELNSSPAHADGVIYVASDGGRVYAVDAETGRLIWRAESFSRFGRREYFYAAPTIAYGRVYIGNTDGTVYAFGSKSGNLLWAKSAGSYVYTAAAVWNRTVYVGSYDGNVYALDAATGDLRWKTPLPASVHGAGTVMDGLVYFSTCGRCGEVGQRYAKVGPRKTFALDARTGKVVWEFPDGQYSPIVADGERVYLTGRTRIYGLEPLGAGGSRRAEPGSATG